MVTKRSLGSNFSNRTRKNVIDHVGNTTHSGVFLTNVEVFGNTVTHCLECLTYPLNLKGLGHAILGNFSTDQMVIELIKI